MKTFHVPDMSCGHCKAAITDALETTEDVKLSFDMEGREIKVTGLAPDQVIDALDNIGFPATQK